MRNYWMSLALGAILCHQGAGEDMGSMRPDDAYESYVRHSPEKWTDASYRFDGTQRPWGAYEGRSADRGGGPTSREQNVMPGYGGSAGISLSAVPRTTPSNNTISLREMLIPQKARSLFRKATRAHANGNRQRSIELLEKAVSVHPDYYEAQNNLGLRYLEAGEVEKAVEHLETARSLEPSKPEIRTNLGAAYYVAGNIPAAADEATSAMELDADYVQAQQLMGMLRAAQGR